MKTYLLVFAILLSGCSIINSDEDPEHVQLRIKNNGTVDFTNVKVAFTGDALSYGEIAAGQTSKYRTFVVAYRYGFIEVETPDDVYQLVPIDYVGERPLEKGNYTFALKIEDGNLVFEFEK
jgi:hypothetical protein